MGLELADVSGISITESTFVDNNMAISDRKSKDILIWNNNFLWNRGDYEKKAGETPLNWSVNGTGNYWSSYEGIDANGDGIGDTPMHIDDRNEDPHPLMRPVDFEAPVPVLSTLDVTVDQHEEFSLDAQRSHDDTWLVNWTWTARLPGGDLVLFGPSVDLVIHPAGEFTVTLRLTDAAGRTSEATVHVTVRDADPPVVTNVSLPDRATTGDPFNVTCEVRDNVELASCWLVFRSGTSPAQQVELHNGSGDSRWATLTAPARSVQPLLVAVGAIDVRGNSRTTAFLAVEVVDDDPPVLGPRPPDHVTTGDAWEMECAIDENIGVSSAVVEYGLPDGTGGTLDLQRGEGAWSAALDVPPNATSPLTVRFVVVDIAGNRAESAWMDVGVLDDDAPFVSAWSTDPTLTDLHKGDPLQVRATVEDNIAVADARLAYHYYGADWEHVEPEGEGGGLTFHILTSTEEGNRLWLRLDVTDGAGNAAAFDVVEVLLLSVHPVITADLPADAYEGSPYRATLSADDPDSAPGVLNWTVDTNAAWLRFSASNLTLWGTPEQEEVGSYWVNVSVDDGEGGSAWALFAVTVHYVDHPPTVEVVSPTPGQRVLGAFTVSGRAHDDGDAVAWVRVRLDGGEWWEATGTAVWSLELHPRDLTSGNHTVEVVAFDGSNESEPVAVGFTFVKEEDGDGSGGVPTTLVAALVVVVVVIASVAAIAILRRRGREETEVTQGSGQ